MSRKGVAACIAFFACHVALVLAIVAISSKEWVSMEHNTKNGTNGTSEATNYTSCTKGLWELCCAKKNHSHHLTCDYLDQSEQHSKFKAVQGLYSTSLATIVLALLLFYAFFIFSSVHDSFVLAAMIAFMEWVSITLVLASLIVYGNSYSNIPDEKADGLQARLAWAYWVALTNGLAALVAGIAAIPHLIFLKSYRPGYEEL